MSDRSAGVYRGLIAPDVRQIVANLWASESSYEQAGPEAGVPVAQQDSEMVLQASGSQSAGGALRVQISQPGHAGPDIYAAEFVWKQDGDTYWRGQLGEAITSIEAVEWCDGTAPTNNVLEAQYPTAVTLDDGSVLVCVQVTLSSPAQERVRVYKVDPTTGTWSSADVYNRPSGAAGHDMYPAMLVLPSGRILVFHWWETDSDNAQIRMHYSDDDGATWTEGARYGLETAVDISGTPGLGNPGYDLGRLRAAQSDGQVVLLAELTAHNGSLTYTDALGQWASSSLGGRFSQIEITDGTEGYTAVDVCARPEGGFVVLFNQASVTNLVAVRLAYASAVVTEQTTATIDSTTTEAAALAVADDGALHCVHATGAAVDVDVSYDGGETWTDRYFGDALNTGDATAVPSDMGATWQRGRIVLAHNFATSTSYGDSLMVGYLGGYSTFTFGQDQDGRRKSWNQTYLPYELPGTLTPWTAFGTGTQTLSDGALNVQTSTSLRYYRDAAGTGVASGQCLIALFDVDVQSGGSVSALTVAGRVRVDNGALGYGVSVRCSTTGWALYDDVAAGQVGSTQTIDMTAGVQVLVVLDRAGDVRTFYRARSGSHDIEWTAGPSSTGLSDDGGTAGNNQIDFGNITAGTAESNWRLVCWAVTWADNFAASWTNPDDLVGAPLGVYPTYVDDGVRIAAADGPAFAGDQWHIDARYRFAVDHLHPRTTPSPSRTWRSTTTGQQRIAWDLTGFAAASLTDQSLGFAIRGANWRTGSVDIHDGSSWSSALTIDLAQGRNGLTYTRRGAAIEVGSTTQTGDHWIDRGELVGHTVDLGSGKLRRVLGNTEGVWTDSGSATVRRPILYLDGMDDTEPASGTCNIWSPNWVGFLHLANTATRIRGIRLTIDSQSTVDSYLEAGVFVAGPLVVFPIPYSWGRVVALEPTVDVRDRQDGGVTVRRLGAARRRVEFGWAEGVPTHHAAGASPAPPYVLGTSTAGAAPLAAFGAEPWVMQGLLAELDDGEVPLVYCPYVPKGTPDTAQFVQRQLSVYGHVVSSSIRLETSQGNENADELVRVARVTLQEQQ